MGCFSTQNAKASSDREPGLPPIGVPTEKQPEPHPRHRGIRRSNSLAAESHLRGPPTALSALSPVHP
ncbi:hypothetical protein HNQ78_002955 [Phycisphaera mikurensis]|nr:hypothetical protein [Phycisphaera mikurensis]